MDRSLRAVLLGTFTLRFSTGLDGFDAGVLPRPPPRARRARGRRRRRRAVRRAVLPGRAGPVAAVRDPVGPDRPPQGHALRPGLRRRRGPHHRRDDEPRAARRDADPGGRVGRGQRALDPRVHRAWRRPATRSSAGKTAARFEAATLAGLGAGAIVGVKLFEIVGPVAFLFNAVLYGVSFLIYRFGVSDPAGEKAAVAGEHVRVSRYLDLIRTSHVWLLAPTWIAVNAAIGVWLSQSVFQLAEGQPEVPGAAADGRLHGQPDHDRGARDRGRVRGRPDLLGQPLQDATAGRRSSATACSAGPCSWWPASSSTTSR